MLILVCFICYINYGTACLSVYWSIIPLSVCLCCAKTFIFSKNFLNTCKIFLFMKLLFTWTTDFNELENFVALKSQITFAKINPCEINHNFKWDFKGSNFIHTKQTWKIVVKNILRDHSVIFLCKNFDFSYTLSCMIHLKRIIFSCIINSPSFFYPNFNKQKIG